jgi:hypothetical protein
MPILCQMQGLSRIDRTIVEHLLARPQATALEVATHLAPHESTAVSTLSTFDQYICHSDVNSIRRA